MIVGIVVGVVVISVAVIYFVIRYTRKQGTIDPDDDDDGIYLSNMAAL